MQFRPPRLWIIALAAIGLGLSAQPAKAGYYIFDEANSGVAGNSSVVSPYAALTINANSSTGVVSFDLLSLSPNVGLAKFGALGFNLTNATLNDFSNIAITGGPSDPSVSTWSVGTNGHLDGFGDFLTIADSTTNANNGDHRLWELHIVFTLKSGLEGLAVESNFVNANSNGVFFAAEYFPTSGGTGYIGTEPPGGGGGGGGNLVPAPAGLVLLASAVPVLALRRLVRRKPVAA